MFNQKFWPLIALSCFETSVYGLDPFTVGTVISTSAEVIETVSGAAGEASATANAFNDLYSEIDSSATISGPGNRIIQEIKELESLAFDVGYTKEELEQLTDDSKSAESAKRLSTVLQSMTKAIRAGKRVTRLFMRLDEKAKMAQVESDLASN